MYICHPVKEEDWEQEKAINTLYMYIYCRIAMKKIALLNEIQQYEENYINEIFSSVAHCCLVANAKLNVCHIPVKDLRVSLQIHHV